MSLLIWNLLVPNLVVDRLIFRETFASTETSRPQHTGSSILSVLIRKSHPNFHVPQASANIQHQVG